jgi:hypothetical protein
MANPIPCLFGAQKVAALRQSLTIAPMDAVQFLAASESPLIQMIVHANIWSGTVPPTPARGVKGEAVFGVLPYGIQNLPQALITLIGSIPTSQRRSQHLTRQSRNRS